MLLGPPLPQARYEHLPQIQFLVFNMYSEGALKYSSENVPEKDQVFVLLLPLKDSKGNPADAACMEDW